MAFRKAMLGGRGAMDDAVSHYDGVGAVRPETHIVSNVTSSDQGRGWGRYASKIVEGFGMQSLVNDELHHRPDQGQRLETVSGCVSL